MQQKQLMMMLDEKLLSDSSVSDLRHWILQYPYLQPLRYLLIRQVIETASCIEQVHEELSKQLPYISDRDGLFYFLKADCLGWNKWFEPVRKKKVSKVEENRDVLSRIDSYLQIHPTADGTLSGGWEQKLDSFLLQDQRDLRSAFNKAEGRTPSEVQEETEESSISENLAKIYIKQGKFPKALELFQSLMLKYPQKSVYFADQIRFLEIAVSNLRKNEGKS